MSIHFVCTGNLYRSRLAEAYLKSKHLPNIEVSSSGTHAQIQQKGTIGWMTQRLALRHRLIPYLKENWSQTEAHHIENSDLVIFIGEHNYEYCLKNFTKPKKHEVWDIPDFDDKKSNGMPINLDHEKEYVSISEDTYKLITEKVDNLIETNNL